MTQLGLDARYAYINIYHIYKSRARYPFTNWIRRIKQKENLSFSMYLYTYEIRKGYVISLGKRLI